MGIFDSVASIVTADRANSQAAALNRRQFEQTKKLMQRGHQYEVEDMKKAGLNPILSAGGSGASGSAPSAPDVARPDIRLPDFTDILQLKMEQQKVDNQSKMVDIAGQQAAADIPKKGADTALKKAQSKLAQKGLIRADVEGKAAKGIDWLWQRAKEMYGEANDVNQQMQRQKNLPSSGGGEILP